MTDYTKTTNFTAKDALPTGHVNKKINGSLFDTEFDALATHVATKANTASPTLTGILTAPDITLNAANPEILGGDTDGALFVSAGTTSILGSVLKLYGNTHSTKAGDFEFLDDATAVLHYDASGTLFTATGALTTTGNVSVGGNLTVTGTSTFNGGTLTLGDAATDNVVFGADVNSSIIPNTDDTYDLGSASQEWRNLYVDGTAYIDTLDLAGTSITSTAAELNILDGVTSTAAELNILDGVTSTAAELNILDGVTSTFTELNILDGVTATATELNLIDGVTATTAELNILDGVTSTFTELNLLDGVTSTTAELNILDGVTSTAAELNILDGVTAAAIDINLIDGITNGTVIASKAFIADANIDITGGRNITISGELAAATVDLSGVLTTASTIDGRDVATDGTKLDGVEASADVTDTANVTSSGALMDSELTAIASVKALDQGVAAADIPSFAGITTSSAGTSNFRAGVNAGNSIASGGNYNVCVGDEAGTAITTGDRNTSVGYQAGDATTTGGENVAIGWGALTTNISSSGIVAIGDQALSACTAGSNVAVGASALKANIGGSNNVAIGRNCLDANTSASNNTAMGHDCLTTNQTGASCVAVGTYALQNSTVSNNVAIGTSAGSAVSTGAQNTIIGTLCHDNLTTGEYCVALGYNNSPSAVGVDHEIVIGTSVTGGGTNTVRIGTSGGTATLGLDGSDTSWAAASDERLKKDIANSTVGLSFLNDLRPVTFKWQHKDEIAEDLPQYDADSSTPTFGEGKSHHGFIAQEVKAVIDNYPDVLDGNNIWHEDPDGTQQLAQGNLVPMLVKAIQELTARLEVLEGE